MKYIGTKIVEAEKAIRKDGKVYTETDPIPRIMSPAEPGYKVIYADGYESWSPKAIFEAAYRPFTAMSFGQAVELLKLGERVARKGWNGKGMWLRIVIPGTDSNNLDFNLGMECLPYLEMKTADNKLVPWLASQTDILAEDWEIVT